MWYLCSLDGMIDNQDSETSYGRILNGIGGLMPASPVLTLICEGDPLGKLLFHFIIANLFYLTMFYVQHKGYLKHLHRVQYYLDTV